jgi:VCBS repeat-containing protein
LPTAANDTANVLEEGKVSIDVLANDTDVDAGDTITIDSVTSPIIKDGVNLGTAQIIVVESKQYIEFTPSAAFNSLSAGAKSDVVMAYKIKDSNDAISNGQATVTVTGENDAVVIDPTTKLTFTTDEDTSFTITEAQLLVNASDVDNDNLSVTNLSIPNATVDKRTDETTGEISFIVTPAENYNGENIKISFDVSDGQGSEVASGASLTIKAVNDAAVVDDKSFTMQEDGTIIITNADLLANATDVENDTLTISGVGYSGNQGTLTLNQDGTSHTFKPAPNFNGDLQLSFTINDGTVNTTASIYLKVESVNDGPEAENDTATTTENASVIIFNLVANGHFRLLAF